MSEEIQYNLENIDESSDNQGDGGAASSSESDQKSLKTDFKIKREELVQYIIDQTEASKEEQKAKSVEDLDARKVEEQLEQSRLEESNKYKDQMIKESEIRQMSEDLDKKYKEKRPTAARSSSNQTSNIQRQQEAARIAENIRQMQIAANIEYQRRLQRLQKAKLESQKSEIMLAAESGDERAFIACILRGDNIYDTKDGQSVYQIAIGSGISNNTIAILQDVSLSSDDKVKKIENHIATQVVSQVEQFVNNVNHAPAKIESGSDNILKINRLLATPKLTHKVKAPKSVSSKNIISNVKQQTSSPLILTALEVAVSDNKSVQNKPKKRAKPKAPKIQERSIESAGQVFAASFKEEDTKTDKASLLVSKDNKLILAVPKEEKHQLKLLEQQLDLKGPILVENRDDVPYIIQAFESSANPDYIKSILARSGLRIENIVHNGMNLSQILERMGGTYSLSQRGVVEQVLNKKAVENPQITVKADNISLSADIKKPKPAKKQPEQEKTIIISPKDQNNKLEEQLSIIFEELSRRKTSSNKEESKPEQQREEIAPTPPATNIVEEIPGQKLLKKKNNKDKPGSKKEFEELPRQQEPEIQFKAKQSEAEPKPKSEKAKPEFEPKKQEKPKNKQKEAAVLSPVKEEILQEPKQLQQTQEQESKLNTKLDSKKEFEKPKLQELKVQPEPKFLPKSEEKPEQKQPKNEVKPQIKSKQLIKPQITSESQLKKQEKTENIPEKIIPPKSVKNKQQEVIAPPFAKEENVKQERPKQKDQLVDSKVDNKKKSKEVRPAETQPEPESKAKPEVRPKQKQPKETEIVSKKPEFLPQPKSKPEKQKEEPVSPTPLKKAKLESKTEDKPKEKQVVTETQLQSNLQQQREKQETKIIKKEFEKPKSTDPEPINVKSNPQKEAENIVSIQKSIGNKQREEIEPNPITKEKTEPESNIEADTSKLLQDKPEILPKQKEEQQEENINNKESKKPKSSEPQLEEPKLQFEPQKEHKARPEQTKKPTAKQPITEEKVISISNRLENNGQEILKHFPKEDLQTVKEVKEMATRYDIRSEEKLETTKPAKKVEENQSKITKKEAKKQDKSDIENKQNQTSISSSNTSNVAAVLYDDSMPAKQTTKRKDKQKGKDKKVILGNDEKDLPAIEEQTPTAKQDIIELNPRQETSKENKKKDNRPKQTAKPKSKTNGKVKEILSNKGKAKKIAKNLDF